MPVAALSAVALGSPWGCARPPGGFDSPEPASRLDAIAKAAQTRDQQAIPRLIELLESDDPVVRMASIRTLELLTGQTLGYDYAASPSLRRDAVDQWVRWYKERQPGTPDAHAGSRTADKRWAGTP